jgi:hypothetical protein
VRATCCLLRDVVVRDEEIFGIGWLKGRRKSQKIITILFERINQLSVR